MMKKRIKKLLAAIFMLLGLVMGGLVTLTFYPVPLFAGHVTHGAFEVYHPKDLNLEGIRPVLEQAYTLAVNSELHDPALRFPIFFSNNTLFDRIEDLQGAGPIARATAGNITIKGRVDFVQNRAFSKRSMVPLSNLLAHEMVHIQQAHRYGLINFSPIKHPPLWKLEGYPEYIARNEQLHAPGYSLQNELKRYLDLAPKSTDYFIEVTPGHWMPLHYYKGRLMIEYLIGIRKMTYDEVLRDTRSETEIFSELTQWAHR